GQDPVLAHLVVPRREGQRVTQVLPDDLRGAGGVHEAHRYATAERRVRAAQRVADREDPGRYRAAVHHGAPPPVHDAAHREDLADRLAVQQVRVQRAGTD